MRDAKLKLAAAVLVAVLATTMTACGAKEEDPSAAPEPERFDLALDWFVNPDHVGIYETIARGYFEAAGLDVQPQAPSDPSAPIRQVAAGRADLAISYEPEVFLAREEGLDVIAVAALVNGPLTSLISLPPAGIEEPADLAGKTVATAGIPYQAAYLETILARAGVSPTDVRQVDVGLNLQPALLGGRADAVLGSFRNIEGVELRMRGENPRIVGVEQIGVPTYNELVLVARGETLDEMEKEIGLFISALARGTRDAAADPDRATASLLGAAEGLDPRLTRAQVGATLPHLQPQPDLPFGHMDAERWRTFGAWMVDSGLISELPDLDEVLTDDLLPEPAES